MIEKILHISFFLSNDNENVYINIDKNTSKVGPNTRSEGQLLNKANPEST